MFQKKWYKAMLLLAVVSLLLSAVACAGGTGEESVTGVSSDALAESVSEPEAVSEAEPEPEPKIVTYSSYYADRIAQGVEQVKQPMGLVMFQDMLTALEMYEGQDVLYRVQLAFTGYDRWGIYGYIPGCTGVTIDGEVYYASDAVVYRNKERFPAKKRELLIQELKESGAVVYRGGPGWPDAALYAYSDLTREQIQHIVDVGEGNINITLVDEHYQNAYELLEKYAWAPLTYDEVAQLHRAEYEAALEKYREKHGTYPPIPMEDADLEWKNENA